MWNRCINSAFLIHVIFPADLHSEQTYKLSKDFLLPPIFYIGVVKFGMTHMSIYRHDTKARWLSVYLSFSLDNLPLSSAIDVEASGSGLITPTTEPSLVAILSNFNLGTPNTSTDAVSDLLPINF